MINDRKKFIRLGVLFIAVVVFIILIFYLSKLSRIRIDLPQNSGQVSVRLVDVDSSAVENFTLDSSTTLFRESGRYNIFVSNEDESYVSYIDAGGFFTETKVVVSLSESSSLSFEGPTSDGCIIKTSVILTYACDGDISTLKYLISGNENSPPTATYYRGDIKGLISGSVTSSNRGYLLVQDFSIEGSPTVYSVAVEENRIVLRSIFSFSELNSTTKYHVSNYKESFLIYDSNLNNFLVFNPIDLSVTSINGYESYAVDDLSVANITNNSENIIVTLNNANNIDRSQEKSSLIKGTIDGPENIFTLDYSISKAYLCDSNSLCALEKNNLFLFNFKDGKITEEAKFIGVNNFAIVDGYIYAIYNTGVLKIDVENKLGNFATKFMEDYFSASNIVVQNNEPYFILNSGFSNHLIRLETTNQTSNSAVLTALSSYEQSTYVKSVSINKDKIYISPDVGGIVFDEELRIFDYSKELKAAASKEISGISESLNLNDKGIKVINLNP